MKILLLCSAFNGLTHAPGSSSARLVTTSSSGCRATPTRCERPPPKSILTSSSVRSFASGSRPTSGQRYRTIIVHPGPPGDRGPSSLDWAISEAAPAWGVTALQAVEEMDGGPIWAYRTFAMPWSHHGRALSTTVR